MNKFIYIILGITLISWVGYRAYRISSESQRTVFNAARDVGENRNSRIEIRDSRPLHFINGRADLPCVAAKKINAGDSLSGGAKIGRVIKSPSSDTGLCAVFANVPDGILKAIK